MVKKKKSKKSAARKRQRRFRRFLLVLLLLVLSSGIVAGALLIPPLFAGKETTVLPQSVIDAQMYGGTLVVARQETRVRRCHHEQFSNSLGLADVRACGCRG